MARPKLPSDQKRSQSVTFKVTASQRQRLEDMVELLKQQPEHEAANVGVSYVVRLAMLKGLDLLEFEYRQPGALVDRRR